jgi:hypothetical protein
MVRVVPDQDLVDRLPLASLMVIHQRGQTYPADDVLGCQPHRESTGLLTMGVSTHSIGDDEKPQRHGRMSLLGQKELPGQAGVLVVVANAPWIRRQSHL